MEINLIQSIPNSLVSPALNTSDRYRAIHDSGASICIFSLRHLFSDFRELRIRIRTAGKIIYSDGIGTVGNIQNCLYVPALQKQLLSVPQICGPFGFKIIFDQHSCAVVNEVNTIIHTSTTADIQRTSNIRNYIAGTTNNALIVQTEIVRTQQQR